MHPTIAFLRYARTSITNHVADLSQEQMLLVPKRFDNNILWNIGHIMVSQQSIIYRRSGLPVNVSDEMVAMYKPGTSPADWNTLPNGAELIQMMLDQQQTLEDDFATGKFSGPFEALSTSGGLAVNDIEGAFAFNLYHESLHWGAIQSLKNCVI